MQGAHPAPCEQNVTGFISRCYAELALFHCSIMLFDVSLDCYFYPFVTALLGPLIRGWGL